MDSDFNEASPQFTLTCISTGGPATTVTWYRDSATVTEGNETLLNNRVTAQYTHTLTVTGRLGGLYTCTVANNKPSTASAQLAVLGILYSVACEYRLCNTLPPASFPPTGVSVSQNGLGSILVSWTPPASRRHTVTGYIIYYQQKNGEHSGLVTAGSFATTKTITGLIAGATYSITMLATSSTLPSTLTGAVTTLIGIYDNTCTNFATSMPYKLP